jgi:lipopolysaccharide export system protein LptA
MLPVPLVSLLAPYQGPPPGGSTSFQGTPGPTRRGRPTVARSRRAPGSWAGLGLGLLAVAVLAPLALAAQEERGACDVPRHEGFTSLLLSNGTRVLYFSRPTIRCPGGTRITADSAVVYESTRYNQLFGNVVFLEGDSRLRADQAQYFEREGRLVAWGNPVLTDQAEGSVIRGDTMVFVRAGAWQPEDRLTVTGRRPHATLYPARRPPQEALPAVPSDSVTARAGERPLPDSAAMGVGDPPVPDSAAMGVGDPPLPDSAAMGVGDPPVPDSSVRPEFRELAGAGVPDTLTMSEPQESGERIPYEVYAQRIVLEGSRFFRATGSVEIARDSLDAEAESVVFDQEVGFLSLTEEARVKTSSTDLSADSIRLDLPEDAIREVYAKSYAVLEGEDVRVLAPIIVLFLTEGRLERLVAVRDVAADSLRLAREAQAEEEAAREPSEPRRPLPEAVTELGLSAFPHRPLALAEDFRLLADSLEVLAPGEVLNQVRAMGGARGEATGRDSLNAPDTPSIILVDWLEGDTIVATFARIENSEADMVADTLVVGGIPSAAVPDSQVPARDSLLWTEEPEVQPDSAESRYRLERLVARVAARSLYRMEPSDSTAREEGRLAVHYVVGDQIIIVFSQGEIERMEVENARGMHMEPVARQRRVGEPGGDTPPPATGGGEGR